MKYYALLHGVCGLAEGYSDTTVRWFNDLDKAMEAKQRTLESLMCRYEEIVSSTDGMQDIVIIDDDNSEHEILKIIPYRPLFSKQGQREYLVWNQMECQVEYEGEHLPTDMGVFVDLCDRLEAVTDTVSVEVLHEFITDLWYVSAAMFDADDICIYYFKIPQQFNS